MRGLFIPEITAEMFRNGCLETIEALMAEGEIYDIEYSLKQEPCEDCISRKAVLELIADYDLSMGQVVRAIHSLPRAIPDLSEYIDKPYKVAYERGKAKGQEWCTVAPPDVGEYLVTVHDWDEHRTYIDIGEYDEDGWNYKGFITVKAWMPLPAPYKQEGKNECNRP